MLIGQDIVGIWKQIDDQKNKPQSLVAVYEYDGKYFGRIIATYDPEGKKIEDSIYVPFKRAPSVQGHPFYSGLDFIWNLEKSGTKYVGGKILDPEEGDIYDAEMWIENGNLIVRGEILFIGKNQKWLRAEDSDFPPNFKKPDLTKMVPKIPVVEKN